MYNGVTGAESCLLSTPTFDCHRALPRLARAGSSFPLIGRVSEPSIIHIHHLQQSSQFHQDTDGNHHIAHSIFEHTHFRPIQTAASVHDPSGTPAEKLHTDATTDSARALLGSISHLLTAIAFRRHRFPHPQTPLRPPCPRRHLRRSRMTRITG